MFIEWIVIGAVTLPFVFLVMASRKKRALEYQNSLQKMLIRAGIQSSEMNLKKNDSLDFSDKTWFVWLSNKIKQAGIQEKKQVTQLVLAQVLATFISLLLLVLNFQSMNDTVLMLVIALPFVVPLFIFIQLKKRQARLRKEFPEMLDSIVRSLQSGYSIDGAVGAVAEDMVGPLAEEMKVMNKQLSIGMSMRDILRDFQSRVNVPESHFFVVTLIIQRETGGQLAGILSELAKLMRRRERFQAKVRTLTAESRFTAWFIGGAPVLYILYKYFFDKESMQFFLNDPLGMKMFGFSVGMILVGSLILRQMLRMRF